MIARIKYPSASLAVAQAPAPDKLEESLRLRVRKLVDMGHRGSGTDNEHRAAEFLLGRLKAAGIDATKEAFVGSKSHGARLLAHIILGIISLAVLLWQPWVAGGIAAVVLASLVAEQMTRGIWLSRFVCRATSYNVVGRVPALHGPTRRVVLCAHYDTQKCGWICNFSRWLAPVWARSPRVLKPPLLTLGLIVIANMALAGIAAWSGVSRPVEWGMVLIGASYLVFAIFCAEWAAAQSVPGGADNASGVAVATKLAEMWHANRPADDVELILLLPGCEEVGLLGAAAWADRHREMLSSIPTTVLNLDGLGFGPPRFLGAEVPGFGLPLRAPAPLVEVCAQVAGEMGLIDAGPHALPGPTDALAFLARGMSAISIVGFADGERLVNYHTMRDNTSNVDFPATCLGLRFAKAVAWKLARDSAK